MIDFVRDGLGTHLSGVIQAVMINAKHRSMLHQRPPHSLVSGSAQPAGVRKRRVHNEMSDGRNVKSTVGLAKLAKRRFRCHANPDLDIPRRLTADLGY